MTVRRLLPLGLSLAAFAALLVSAAEAAAACRAALQTCARLLIPSLFPFFVLSSLLSVFGLPALLGRLLGRLSMRLYGISGAGASALVLGLCGGYPSGAAYLGEMERSGAISAEEGERLLAFCNNSGPAFAVGALGLGVFHSVRIGLFLYAVHALSALLTGLFFRGQAKGPAPRPVLLDEADPARALAEAVKRAALSLLQICGFVVFFTALLAVLDAGGGISLLCGLLHEAFGWELSFARALCTGLLELGSGAAALEGLRPSPATLALASWILSWGGLSVHFQTLSVLSDSKITGALHLAGRLISACISAAMAFGFSLCFLF
ncbi:MAG: sporulation protein [Oscillospiraceae bacterium]|nr:sporulation protein [Oscillospiraceae bacterium]